MGLEGKSIGVCADYYMDRYKRLQEAAENKISAFCGVEIELGANEYLVYNIDRDFLIDLGLSFYKLSLRELAGIAHDHGCLIYQSHPFRPWLHILPPEIFRCVGEAPSRDKLDGMETINYGSNDYFYNDTALDWAKAHNLRTITGSDYHGEGGRSWGGIYSEYPVNTPAELVKLLQSDRYALSLPDVDIPPIGEMHPQYRFKTERM